MYKVTSKKVGDSPKHSEKSAKSETIQKKESKASDFLKPSQPNLFRDSGQPVVQEMAELAAIQGGSLRKQAAENSDKKTHFRHMKAGERFDDEEAFIDESREEAIAKTEEQAINRINGEISEIEKRKQRKKTRKS